MCEWSVPLTVLSCVTPVTGAAGRHTFVHALSHCLLFVSLLLLHSMAPSQQLLAQLESPDGWWWECQGRGVLCVRCAHKQTSIRWVAVCRTVHFFGGRSRQQLAGGLPVCCVTFSSCCCCRCCWCGKTAEQSVGWFHHLLLKTAGLAQLCSWDMAALWLPATAAAAGCAGQTVWFVLLPLSVWGEQDRRTDKTRQADRQATDTKTPFCCVLTAAGCT